MRHFDAVEVTKRFNHFIFTVHIQHISVNCLMLRISQRRHIFDGQLKKPLTKEIIIIFDLGRNFDQQMKK